MHSGSKDSERSSRLAQGTQPGSSRAGISTRCVTQTPGGAARPGAAGPVVRQARTAALRGRDSHAHGPFRALGSLREEQEEGAQ